VHPGSGVEMDEKHVKLVLTKGTGAVGAGMMALTEVDPQRRASFVGLGPGLGRHQEFLKKGKTPARAETEQRKMGPGRKFPGLGRPTNP